MQSAATRIRNAPELSSAAALAAGFAALHALSLGSVVPVDDDFIVYRYARNLIESGEYAYNVGGPAVEGVTSPLWLALCVLGLWMGAAPETWTAIIGVGSFAGLAWCTSRAAACILPRTYAWLPGLLVAASPAVAWHARAGLGTVPLAWAISAALWAWTAGRSPWRVGAWLAAGVLFRLEALVLVLPFLLSSKRVVALPMLALGAVTLWRLSVFGSFVPAPATLKDLPISAELTYGARYVASAAREGGTSLLLIVGAFASLRRGRVIAPWGMGVALATLAIVIVGGDWMVYGRFFVPFLGVGAVCSCAVFTGMTSNAARNAGLAFLAGVTVFGFTARRQAIFENEFFEQWWLVVGDLLRDSADPNASVATSPIGAIGWRSDLEIIDVLGLTHDEFHGRPPDLENVSVKGHHRFDGSWVLTQDPDYLLLGNAVLQPDTGQLSVNPWEADIAQDPRLMTKYVRRGVELDSSRPRVLPYFKRTGALDLSTSSK